MLNDNDLKNKWFLQKNFKEKTKNTYEACLTRFTEKSGVKLSDIYNTHKKYGTLKDTEVELKIFMFFSDITNDKDTSYNYCKTIYACLQSFCSSYDIRLPEINIKGTNKPENYRRLILKNEIQTVMKYSDIRTKATISIAAMSGMRANEISNMRISEFVKNINETLNSNYANIDEILDDSENVLKCDVFKYTTTSSKTNFIYTTFLPSQTVSLILDYVRTIPKDKLYEHDYLFRQRQNKKLESYSVNNSFKRAAERAGLDKNKQKNQYSLFVPHQLRRYFFTNVMNTVGITYADMWTGHKLSDVHNAYIRVDEIQIEKYKQCLPVLSIVDTTVLRDSEREEYEMLKEHKQDLLKLHDLCTKMNLFQQMSQSSSPLI